MRKGRRYSILIGLFIFLFYAGLVLAEDTITIGRVADNFPKYYRELKPFIDYLASKLKHTGIKQGKVLLARDNQELIEFVRQGRVDIVTETPFSSMLYCDKAGMKILLRRWKKGVSSYYSVIIVRKDSGINSLKDLKGKVIAIEDPGSTSGYFLPKADIIKNDFQIVELNNVRERPPADKIGYCFAKSEVNIGHWVHKGWVDAGALSNLEYEDPEDVPTEFIPDFKVIFETEEVPRSLILVREDMDSKLETEIKKILLNMKLSEEGRKAMQKMSKTTDFDEPPEGIMIKVTEKYNLIKDEIGSLP